MSLAVIHTRALLGLHAPKVIVEAHISKGLPCFTLVGLPETAVRESRDRVRSAILNSGYQFPTRKITINLAPADLPKEGARFDLPIALAILIASQQLRCQMLNRYEFIGELALTGTLRAVSGVISSISAGLKAGKDVIVPAENAEEAGLIDQPGCFTAERLAEVCAWLQGKAALTPPCFVPPEPTPFDCNLSDIIGQSQGKRALEIAASGGHNLLLVGPPGTGKSMLATRLATLLPPLSNAEALQCAAIQSLVSQRDKPLKGCQRPFRAPHHGASLSAMVGGGAIPQPGEISLAHNGVLLLDELPEFDRRVLDALREPLESGSIHLSRAKAKITYPACFQLIATMNPSPTGHAQGQLARSSPQQSLRYLSRLSGPFLDRFDLSVDMPLLPRGALSQTEHIGESSQVVAIRVQACRQIQLKRQQKLNAHLSNAETRNLCSLHKDDALWLENTLITLGLSVRTWQRLLKVARTIADMESDQKIARKHLQEALAYRAINRLLSHLQHLVNG